MKLSQAPANKPHTVPDLRANFAEIERERAAIYRAGRLNFVHWFVLAASLLLTLGVWQYSRVQVQERTAARFETTATQIPVLFEERLQKYELALWAGVSALQLHGVQMSLAEWQMFATNLEIEHRYPGINGIGVIHQVSPDELEEYLSRQRRLRPDFEVHPFAERDIYQPITFIEPNDINAAAVGLDMMHEVNRKDSLAKARDTGTAQITGPIVLVQDEEGTPGFLFFAPFFAEPNPQTVGARQASFSGAVYAPFIVHNLIDGVLDQGNRTVQIRIRDGESTIYDEFDPDSADYDPNTLGSRSIQMDIYGRQWTVDVRAGLAFRASNPRSEAVIILVAGILIDLALFIMFLLLTRANRRGLAFSDTATAALRAQSQALIVSNHELEVARQQAEAVSETKSKFLSTMSHEVRTPLTAISGILVLLERAKLPERQEKLVRAGQQASEKLMKLLTNVLDISRLEAQAVQLWQRTVTIESLIEEWRILGQGLVERVNKDITVVSHVEDDVPSTIQADDVRLSQVMNNLMDNAIRFTDDGEIAIKVSNGADRPDGTGTVKISLTDTGSGISEDNLDLVFERFQQVDGSITREHGGSGLGLAICEDLVKLMDGTIGVSSELGVGTSFTVTLPTHGNTNQGPAHG